MVFGGVNSTALWENMLRNRDFIDGVMLYDGEQGMFCLLNRLKERGILGDDCFKGVPNLSYRDSKGNVHSPEIRSLRLEDIPDIDYSLFDLDSFFKATEKKGFGKAVTYYAGKGCAKRGNVNLKGKYSIEEYNSLVNSMDTCSFCGRNELGLRCFEEERESRIVRELHDKHNVRGFFNVQDTVNLQHSSPIGINDSWFRLFIGTEGITLRNIKKLRNRYGPNLIFQAGIETTDPEMRKVYGKTRTNPQDIYKKTRMMKDEGVQLHASFILGGRGETEDSMKKTTETIQKLSEYDNVTWLLISPQLILPGSPDYKAFLQMPRMYKKYGKEDMIDIAEINRDFLTYFAPCITREKVIDEIKTTFEDIRRRNEDVTLDVKGVVGEEETYINPSRPYMWKSKK